MADGRIEAAAEALEAFGYAVNGYWRAIARTAIEASDKVDPLRSPATTDDRADIEEALSDHLAQCPMVEMAQRLNGTPAASWWFKLMELRYIMHRLTPLAPLPPQEQTE